MPPRKPASTERKAPPRDQTESARQKEIIREIRQTPIEVYRARAAEAALVLNPRPVAPRLHETVTVVPLAASIVAEGEKIALTLAPGGYVIRDGIRYEIPEGTHYVEIECKKAKE